MTVSSTESRKTYAGDGSTTSFATSPVIFFDDADLTVYVVTTATGAVLATLVLNTDYTVTGGDGAVGTVDLTGGSSPYGAPAVGTTLVIVRTLAIVQESDLQNNDSSDAEVLEDALDRHAIVSQGLNARLDRKLGLADSDVSSLSDLPPVSERASKFLAFDEDGDVAAVDGSDGTTGSLAVALAASGGSALVTFTPSGIGMVSQNVQEALGSIVITFDGAGAEGDDSTDDTTAIQRALDRAYDLGGGTVKATRGKTYKITDDLIVGNRVQVELDGATIKQYTADTPCFSVIKASLNELWGVRNGICTWSAQQTESQTGAVGVQLATTSVTSYNGKVQNLKVKNGYGAVSLPELSGCHAFFIDLDNVVALDCASYGFDLLGDTSGAQTNIWLRNCWSVQTAGSENSTSRGYRLKRINGLLIDNCGADHIQNSNIFDIDTCQGVIGTASVESCDITASSGTHALFRFSGCNFEVGVLIATDNNVTISGTAAAMHTRVISSSVVHISALEDRNTTVTDTSSDAYYTINGASTERIYVDNYISTGSTPASVIAEFGQHLYLRYLDGNARMNTEGGKDVVFRTAAPTAETWAIGDRVFNTAPALGEPIGWTCITAGTPGTWHPFGMLNSVSADKGNAASTFTPYASDTTFIYNTAIDADRAVTLTTTGAYNGLKLRVVRTAASTGAFKVNVGTGPLAALDPGEWCDVEFDGSAYVLTAFGALA